MNQDYYFPLFGLFATAGKIFLLSEGGGEQSDKADPEKYARQRRGRFLRVICGSMPALAGLEPPVTFAADVFADPFAKWRTEAHSGSYGQCTDIPEYGNPGTDRRRNFHDIFRAEQRYK